MKTKTKTVHCATCGAEIKVPAEKAAGGPFFGAKQISAGILGYLEGGAF